MSWRTIYVESASKLSLNLNNLKIVYRRDTYNISLDEIGMIIIEDYSCLLTARLLSKLCEEGIVIVFTKPNKMPIGALHSYSNNSRTAKINKIQFEMSKDLKRVIWKNIVEIKILSQANTLKLLAIEDEYLTKYATEVQLGDISNKEGQASRVYFKKLFGYDFVRFDQDLINYSLNYTYQILRSKITQEVIGRGLHPPFGIFHRGEYNYFNLCDDLIEPYRPIADYYVFKVLESTREVYLTPILKSKLINIVNYNVIIDNKKMKLSESMKLYLNSYMNILQKKTLSELVYPMVYVEQI